MNQILQKIIICNKSQLITTPKKHKKTKSHEKPTKFLKKQMQLLSNWACKMKKLSDLQVVFMQKLRSCLTTLKSYFDRNLKPVFDIK